MTSSIEGKGTKMIDLISRLKPTTAKQNVAPQPKKAIVATVKVPAATKATVTTNVVKKGPAAVTVTARPATTVTTATKCIMPTVANMQKPCSTTSIDQAILNRGMQNKLAENTSTNKQATNQEIIAKYRAEYEKFLKQLESMDFGSLIFGQQTVEPKKQPTPTTPVQKPVPVAPANIEAPVTPKAEPAVAPAIEPEPEPAPSLIGDFANGISVGEEMGDKVMVPAKRTRRKKSVSVE